MKYGLFDSQLKTIEEILASHPEIEEALLFGSRAMDTFKEASDVDIALKGSKVNSKLAIKLQSYFEEETDLPYFFDFVSYSHIDNKNLIKHIDKEGIIIYRKGWRTTKLGDVTKFNQKSIDKNYSYKDIKYLDTGSITKGRIESLQVLNIQKAPNRAKRLVKDKNIIYSNVRPIQRHYGFIKNPIENFVVSTGFSVIEVNQSKAHSYFIYNVLTSNDIVEKLDKIAEGTTTAYPSLKPSDIENLKIKLPPLPEQKAIAEVLSSLDDKIELLHEQNKTLENIAQILFHKYFIKDAKPHWQEKPLSYFGEIICGKTPSKKVPEYFRNEIPFIKIPDMHNNTFVFKTEDMLSKLGQSSQHKKILPEKSICVSCIATVGLISMNAFKSQTNQQINSIVPNRSEYRYFIYLFMKKSKALLEAMARGGTATMNLNTGDFSKIKILMPSNKIILQFHSIIKPLFEKIFHNQSQILELEKLRDTILPKLITGQIRVKCPH